MSSRLAAGTSYRCAQSETEVSDLDIDDGQLVELSDNDNNVDQLPGFTRNDLLAFDGQTLGQPIYIAVLGNVYDVSTGRKFYGPGN